MATSGTIGQTTITVATLLDHALRRAGISPANATPDIVDAAKNNLYFYLMQLSNAGVNLWTIEKKVIGFNKNQSIYEIGLGTIDIKNALRRTVTLPSDGTAYSSDGGNADLAFDQDINTACTQTSPNGYIYYDFGEDVTIVNVGLMPNGTNTYELSWEYTSDPDDQNSWTSVLENSRAVYTDKQWTYYDIDAPQTAQYFRVKENSGGTLDVREIVFARIVQEIPISRISFDQYSNLTNKTFTANMPLELWFDRKALNPVVHVWPTPSTYFDQMVIWKTRQIQDVGGLRNTLEIPDRWIESAVTELARRMVLELPKVDTARYNLLASEADRATKAAQDEERDRSPISVTPSIGCYTK